MGPTRSSTSNFRRASKLILPPFDQRLYNVEPVIGDPLPVQQRGAAEGLDSHHCVLSVKRGIRDACQGDGLE